jgi:hypothetical protein
MVGSAIVRRASFGVSRGRENAIVSTNIAFRSPINIACTRMI